MVRYIYDMLAANRGKFYISESCRLKYGTSPAYYGFGNYTVRKFFRSYRSFGMRSRNIGSVYIVKKVCVYKTE